MIQVFLEEANEERVLDKAGFDRCMQRLVPTTDMSDDDRAFLTTSLDAIFQSFDHDGNGVVDYEEFSSGFCMLAAGSSKDRLAMAFRMLDEDGDGTITRHELWKFLRSFLTVLVSVQNPSVFAKGGSMKQVLSNNSDGACTVQHVLTVCYYCPLVAHVAHCAEEEAAEPCG